MERNGREVFNPGDQFFREFGGHKMLGVEITPRRGDAKMGRGTEGTIATLLAASGCQKYLGPGWVQFCRYLLSPRIGF
jgi:hypothetical protein